MFRQLLFLTFLTCAIAIQLPHHIRDDDDDDGNARACEFCTSTSRCARGHLCQSNTCERVKAGSPRCSVGERCGRGQRRRCRTFRQSDRNESGELKKERKDKGFFVGRTFMVRRCRDGLKRFRCERSASVCRHNFCITFTLKECEARGLVRGTVNADNQFTPCCVYVLPRDCFAVQLCKCVRKDDD